MESAWPLTGRLEELAGIRSVLAGVGDYAGVLLSGDAGVGKSRLAREALAAMSQIAEVRWVVATASGRALPLGAFAEWIRDAGSDPAVLVRGVIQALTTSEHGRPVVLGVDDAHFLDDLSAFVVHQLVHRGLARVVVTVRNRQTPPEAITALWKDSYLQRMELGPLTRGEFDELLTAVLGGTIDPVTAQRLWQLTQGNVLFLRHLFEQEVDSGRLSRTTGTWSWRGESIAFVTLGELIDAQMGALSKPLGDVVDLLAVGEPFDVEVLAGMADWQAIDEAETKGLVTLEHQPLRSIARLAHPLYGELRRARAGPPRLRRLRGRVVRALGDTPVVDSRDLIHRALLLLDSDLPPDPDLFTQAAGAAFQLLDPVLAERLAGAARQTGRSYEATVLHTFALHLIGEVTESERLIAETGTSQFTPDQQSNLAMFRAGNLFWGIGLADRATSVLDVAQARIPARSGSGIRAFRTVLEAANGSPQTAVDAAMGVLASKPTDAAAMGAYFSLMLAHGHAGRVTDLLDVAKHGYGLAERSFDAAPIVFAYTELYLQALILAGLLSDAEALTEKWARQTAEIPVVSTAYAALFMGQTQLGVGRVAAARRWFERALQSFVGVGGPKFGLVICRSELVVALAISGELTKAARALAALDAENNPYAFMESRCALAAAWVSAVEGAMTDAVPQIRRGAAAAQRRGHFADEVVCLQTATRFGDREAASRFAELCDVVDGPRVAAAAAHAAALASDDPDGLHAASDQLERMGDLLAAADAAAQAAVIYRAVGRKGSALSARERVQRLAGECGPVTTPAIRALRASPLTARQQEILALAAQGMSNKEIAERLNVSVRTVEGHRYRATRT